MLLDANQADSIFLAGGTVSPAAAALPKLKGYGNVKNLDLAITGDPTLLSQVTSFKALPTTTWAALKAAADDILLRWAQVDGVAATPMTTAFDRQKLAFLEKDTGSELTPRDGGGNPSLANVAELAATWNDTLDRLTVRLAVQGPLKPVLGALNFDAASDRILAGSATALADTYKLAFGQLSTTAATAQTQWSTIWGPMFSAFGNLMLRADGVEVRDDYEIASLVRAFAQTPPALTLTQLVQGMGFANVQVGTSGADALARGTATGLQVYAGQAGNDTLTGGRGQDVYVFGPGFGQDTISDSESLGTKSGDRIRLATLNPSDVTIARVGANLVITVTATGDRITVNNHFATPSFAPSGMQTSADMGIEDIQFAAGSIYEAAEIATKVGIGTNAAEMLTGSALSDELNGLKGNEIMRGGDGGDMYVYSKGDGADTIEDIMLDPANRGSDTLLLLGGIKFEDMTFARVGKGDDFTIGFPMAGDSLLINGQFAYNERGYQTAWATDQRIDMVFLEGGGGYSWLDIQAQTIKAYTTAGNDFTYGYGTSDTYAWSTGNDFLQGLDAGDIYKFGKGAGQDTISDGQIYGDTFLSGLVGYTYVINDTVVFDSGIAVGDVNFSRIGASDDLRIAIAGTIAMLASHTGHLSKDTPVENWFQDEARIGQKNGLTRLWARRGTRPRQPKDQRYDSAFLFGAICPARNTGAGLVMPAANTEAMQAHLDVISGQVAPGALAVLRLDWAGWHTTGRLKVPGNIIPILLPSRAPELNPVENVWQFLRQNWLSNRVFENYQAILEAACDAWNRLLELSNQINSIGLRDWAHRGQSS